MYSETSDADNHSLCDWIFYGFKRLELQSEDKDTKTKCLPFEPAEILGSKDSGRVLPSATEAVRRQPFPCHRMNNLQIGATGQPGQAATTWRDHERLQGYDLGLM